MILKPIKLVIVGAGIAGLSAAVYARKSGFQTLVLEKNTVPGGLSTSWRRKGYTIEGGIHWLTGSSPRLPHHKIWKEIGALQDNNPVYVKDPLYTLMGRKRRLSLYRDLDRTFKELAEAAPEDIRPLRRLVKHIRSLEHFHAPIADIRGLKAKYPSKASMKDVFKMFPAFLVLPHLMRRTIGDYLRSFKNNDLRTLLGSFINHEQNALSLVYTLSSYMVGDGGYPKGGSLVMAGNIADTVTSLGGEILYNKSVTRIVVEDGTVKGVQAGEEFFPADAVIVSPDARMVIDNMFDEPVQEPWAEKMRQGLDVDQCLIMSAGIKADLSSYPRNMVFSLDKPFEYSGTAADVLMVNNYAADSYAPEGCTAVTSLLFGDIYDFWKKAKDDGSYREKKKDICERYVALIESLIPEAKGKVEMTDLATPMTLQRYCGTHKGSFMSLWKPSGFPPSVPVKYHKAKGLYFAGQRTGYSGGLPVAALSGRTAVQHLCRDNDVVFVG
ncbi:MAG: NAD(P)/FAD-dependent oxidoreductase [Bacteroidales bacterium]|nr:NAD(P)/FAD-dependent oxidoreductase [Bacteroidales bacterium]